MTAEACPGLAWPMARLQPAARCSRSLRGGRSANKDGIGRQVGWVPDGLWCWLPLTRSVVMYMVVGTME